MLNDDQFLTSIIPLANLTFEENQLIFMTDLVQEISEIDPSSYKECAASQTCVHCNDGRIEFMCYQIRNFFISFPLLQFITRLMTHIKIIILLKYKS